MPPLPLQVQIHRSGGRVPTVLTVAVCLPSTLSVVSTAPPLQVWNVQTSGARGAIVVNFEDKMTTMEAPDDDDEASYKYMT